MKESNTPAGPAGNATIKQHQNQIFQNTKGQSMKASSTLAGIVTSNLQIGQVSQGTKENYTLLVIVQFDKKMNY